MVWTRTAEMAMARARMQRKFHVQAKQPTDLRRWEKRLRGLYESPHGSIRLLVAVLEDAIQIVTRPGPEELVPTTMEWFRGPDDENEYGSFSFVCRELDLEEHTVRADVLMDAARAQRGMYEQRTSS